MSGEPSVKSPTNKRKNNRVTFSREVSVEIVAIDGTWATSCTMLDVAQSGAKLRVDGAIEKLKSKGIFFAVVDHRQRLPSVRACLVPRRSDRRTFLDEG